MGLRGNDSHHLRDYYKAFCPAPSVVAMMRVSGTCRKASVLTLACSCERLGFLLSSLCQTALQLQRLVLSSSVQPQQHLYSALVQP